METLGGGWERIAEFEASAITSCPSENLLTFELNGRQLCSNNGTIVDIRFTPLTSFSEVRGTVSAYATGDLHAFRPSYSFLNARDFHGRFVDGVAFMLDDSSGAYKHIYSYGVGNFLNAQSSGAKKDAGCNSYGANNPISVISPNYMCSLIDTGNEAGASNPIPFGDLNDELCSVLPRTCARPSAWFHHQLPKDYEPMNTEIVLRVSSQYPGEIMLSSYAFYVR